MGSVLVKELVLTLSARLSACVLQSVAWQGGNSWVLRAGLTQISVVFPFAHADFVLFLECWVSGNIVFGAGTLGELGDVCLALWVCGSLDVTGRAAQD